MCADKDDVRREVELRYGEVFGPATRNKDILRFCPWVRDKHLPPTLLMIKADEGVTISFLPFPAFGTVEVLIAHYIANKCFKIS